MPGRHGNMVKNDKALLSLSELNLLIKNVQVISLTHVYRQQWVDSSGIQLHNN